MENGKCPRDERGSWSISNFGTPHMARLNIALKLVHTLDDAPGGFQVREFTIPELRQALEANGFKVDQDGICGQSLQPYFRLAIIRKLYDMGKKPKKYSPKVAPLNNKAPRYIVIIVHYYKESIGFGGYP